MATRGLTNELADALREAIRKSGKSGYRLAQETTVKQQTISDFMRGKDIRLQGASILAKHFGLELCEQPSENHLADVLRQAIIDSGKTAMQLAKETGVSQPTITEFLRGADMRLRTSATLAKHLDLELAPVRRKPKTPV